MSVTVLSALAEPTRLEAMRFPGEGSELCVCDLMRQPGATQSRMSRHRQILKRAGRVVDRRDAQWVRCRINPELSPRLTRPVEAAMAPAFAAKETET